MAGPLFRIFVGRYAGFFHGAVATVLLTGCSLPEPAPLEQLYDRLDSGGLLYFHADFGRLSESSALHGLVEAVGGGALQALQPELAAGAVMSAETQFVIRTGSAYTGALAAFSSANVKRLEDRLLLIAMPNPQALAEPLGTGPRLPAHDESAAVQVRFRPMDLYALAAFAPRGFNLNFIAKMLVDARTASLTIPAECLGCMRLALTTDGNENAVALRESIAKSLRFVEAVTRAADPSSSRAAAIENASIERDGATVRVSFPLADELLLDFYSLLSQPTPDR